MSRVTHFEIQAENPQRAIDFYSKVLGWQFNQWGDQQYWLITTGPDDQAGINGGLMPRQGAIDGSAVIAFVCIIDTENVDLTLETALAAGATLTMPKMPVPSIGWLAYAKDTEGNIFGMMQTDPQAA